MANTMSVVIRSYLSKAAVVDTTVFKTHSTRRKAASKALATGLSLDSILKVGQWIRNLHLVDSTKWTYCLGYHRQQYSSLHSNSARSALKSPLGSKSRYN